MWFEPKARTPILPLNHPDVPSHPPERCDVCGEPGVEAARIYTGGYIPPDQLHLFPASGGEKLVFGHRRCLHIKNIRQHEQQKAREAESDQ